MVNGKLRAQRLPFLIVACLPLLVLLPLLAQASPDGSASGLRVLESDEHGLLLELHVPAVSLQPTAVDGRSYLAVAAEGLSHRTSEPGAPQVPYLSQFVALPPGALPVVELLDAYTNSSRLSGTVMPAEQPPIEAGASQPARSLVGERYTQDALFPAELVTISEPMYFRDQRLAPHRFLPGAGQPRSGPSAPHPAPAGQGPL